MLKIPQSLLNSHATPYIQISAHLPSYPMSNQISSDRDLHWALQEIISGKMNLQNISFFNSHSASSSHQETENSISINISTNGNSVDEFCQILTLLSAQESRCNPTNLAFYCINWEMKSLHTFSSLLDNNTSIKHVEFQKNIFSTQGKHELSDMLGRNKIIRSIIFSECQIESIGASLLASALMKNDTLEELQIWEDSISSNGAEELSKMIEVNSTLKLLLILDRHFITATPLISAVLARNRNMQVHVWSRNEADENLKIVEFTPETSMLRIYKMNSFCSHRLACALGLNTTVKILDLTGIKLKSKWAKEFRQVLEQNRSLKEVKLSRTCLRDKAVVYIAAGLFKNKSLENLTLDGNRFSGVGVEHLLCPISRFSAFQNQANTTLKSVTFGGGKTRIDRRGVKAILRMLDTNQSIIQLCIRDDTSLKPEDAVRIFKSLEKNATLRYLSLRGCKGVNGELVLQTIMGTLQVNPWIEEIDLTGTPLQISGKTDGIYDKLGKNGSLLPENELLDDMPLTTPKCCRIFFCGQDFAGKSTLCNSMYNNLSSSKVPYMDQIRTLINPVEQIARTAEVKIKVIHDGDIKITIWNLAGQQENFALHDIMFPGHGSPSLFFIISSLFKKPANRERKSQEEIEDDLLYWMRFIVSNSRRVLSQSMPPHVTVVLTHSDKVSHPSQDLISIVINGIQIRVEFGRQSRYYVDVLACSNRNVTEILRLFSQLIMPTIQSLCPGNTLSEYVIRPDCVRYLIPPTFRRNQLVSLPMLKEALLSTPADSMYDYQHSWSSVYTRDRLLLHSGFDYARNLLGDEDFQEVLGRRYNDLHQLADELTIPFECSKKSQPPAGNDGAQKVEPSLLSIAEGVELVLHRMKIIEQEIKDLVNYSIQLEERKVPNMFYFVQVQNYSRRLVTRIISGMTALRLHMLCEYRKEMHVVEEQVGCELLQVDNEAVRCLLP